ncbi:MAG: FAD-dependent oxidoreductase [Bacteroidetes bacterium]|nr:FAD-dependent oxidoreductase [Bacteroidota bacterium]
MKRDGFNVSLWQGRPAFIPKNTTLPAGKQDVVIVGGGITGITTALQLQKAGKKCTLIEAQEIGFGTTGGTTAHLNTMMDTPYYEIRQKFNSEAADKIARLSESAITLIRSNVKEYGIDCSLSTKPGYLCAKDDKQADLLDKILQSCQEVHLPATCATSVPTPTPYIKAMQIQEQAQFHPLDYILALAQHFEAIGGHIIHDCRMTGFSEEDKLLTIQTSKGDVKADALIYATHIPPGVNMLHFLCAPYRTYAIAVKLKGDNYPDALIYDLDDPYHYFRTQEVDGERYLIAGGEDHKTGHEENTHERFKCLEAYVRKYYDVDHVAYQWSSQYYEPADGLPYIGHLPGNPDNVYVATGFGGNGMIYGTASAVILTALITKGESEYGTLLSPDRVKPMASMGNVMKEGATVTKDMITGWLSIPKLEEAAGLAKGEAKVVKYEGKTVALYKDNNGALHAVNPACPHIKCSVGWNNAEKSWDCPCHGSRFSYTGELLTGPSSSDLEKIDLREE